MPRPKLRSIVSHELSPMFSRVSGERYNPDELIYRKGMLVYRRMMSDEQVKAVMVFKRDAITARGWQFLYKDSPSKLSREEKLDRIRVLEGIIRKMGGSFDDAINGILTGRQFGFSLTEKVYDTVKIDGKSYTGINTLVTRDPATFVFYTDKYGQLTKLVQKVNTEEIEVDYENFIHYVQSPEEDRYYGQSDLRQAYRAWYIKDQVIKLYATFLERFAGGFAVLNLDNTSGITFGSREHQELQGVLTNLRNLSGVMLPPGVKMDVVRPNTTEEYREALTYFDLAIAKSLLVPNLLGLSHTGQTGSFSQSQTQLEAFFWTLNADTRRLESTLNEQLFKPLCEMNWGDDDYPQFQFRPANADHVRWLVNAWKDMVGARAVQSTDEDEAYIRGLLNMPSREPVDEEATDKDPYVTLEGSQIKAMLEVLTSVGTGAISKDAAKAMLVSAFPMTEEAAAKMVDTIEVKEPPPLPQPGPPGQPPGQRPPPPPGNGAVPHTLDGKPRLVSMQAFQNAAMRVEFVVIERRAETVSEDAVSAISRLVSRAVRRAVGDPGRLSEHLSDVSSIEHVRLDGSDVGKIKALAKEALQKGWTIGTTSGTTEIAKASAGQLAPATFSDLRDRASEYFEANGFRMAANISDGARAIIQQHLIQAVKQGLRPEDVVKAIFVDLARKGFTSTDAMELELIDAEIVDHVKEQLGLSASTNVASYIGTLVRTNLYEALNEARYAIFTDPALGGFVQALEYSAILDAVTTDICRHLDGKVYAATDPIWNQYRPPNHYNCRSVLIPVTESDGWDGVASAPPSVSPASGFGGQ